MQEDPEGTVKCREEGRAFHREGQMVVKDLVWAIKVLTHKTNQIKSIFV